MYYVRTSNLRVQFKRTAAQLAVWGGKILKHAACCCAAAIVAVVVLLGHETTLTWGWVTYLQLELWHRRARFMLLAHTSHYSRLEKSDHTAYHPGKTTTYIF